MISRNQRSEVSKQQASISIVTDPRNREKKRRRKTGAVQTSWDHIFHLCAVSKWVEWLQEDSKEKRRIFYEAVYRIAKRVLPDAVAAKL